MNRFILIFFIFPFLQSSIAFPDQGLWEFVLDNRNAAVTVVKSLFKGSKIFIEVTCNDKVNKSISIKWLLFKSECWYDYMKTGVEGGSDILNNSTSKLYESPNDQYSCTNNIIIKNSRNGKNDQVASSSASKISDDMETHQVYSTETDGFYILNVRIEEKVEFSANVKIRMKGTYGYLSAADWPLLPFYGGMCLVYLVMGSAWLIVSFLQWRDLLRIQFWIGGVILLGMLEMAAFYAEYSLFNATGTSSAAMLAELASCCKRTLARMLVIVVSLGFGIVKPRLGPALGKVVAVGCLYFVLATVEAYVRVVRPKVGRPLLLASFPLALLDSAICWWIFTSLVQTTRTLRLRRNLVKLQLYRHFTNTLFFAVFASAIFMVYSIKSHHMTVCFKEWKQLWVDEAYWKLLFSIILLVIMILWRPTNNNRRYAFSPLIDACDDDSDEEEQFTSDAYGVKQRASGSPKQRRGSTNSAEEDLKWVEEHIPASLADTALPILDSDEEIMTTKFELSKMQ